MIYRNTSIPLILASASPRRQELLRAAGLAFTVVAPSGEDIPFPYRSPRYYAEQKARLKMEETVKLNNFGAACVLTADTIVVRRNRILEKPCSEADAEGILSMLEGGWHAVYTAYCIALPGRPALVRSVRSQVKFAPLSKREIRNYIATGEPMDKAGAYAIQGYGLFMVEEIEGSYTNIVGLPLTHVLRDLLRLRAIEVRR